MPGIGLLRAGAVFWTLLMCLLWGYNIILYGFLQLKDIKVIEVIY
jgi:hypothetical protein